MLSVKHTQICVLQVPESREEAGNGVSLLLDPEHHGIVTMFCLFLISKLHWPNLADFLLPWSNAFWPGLTSFGPPMWQAEAGTEFDTVCLTYHSSGPKGVIPRYA